MLFMVFFQALSMWNRPRAVKKSNPVRRLVTDLVTHQRHGDKSDDGVLGLVSTRGTSAFSGVSKEPRWKQNTKKKLLQHVSRSEKRQLRHDSAQSLICQHLQFDDPQLDPRFYEQNTGVLEKNIIHKAYRAAPPFEFRIQGATRRAVYDTLTPWHVSLSLSLSLCRVAPVAAVSYAFFCARMAQPLIRAPGQIEARGVPEEQTDLEPSRFLE